MHDVRELDHFVTLGMISCNLDCKMWITSVFTPLFSRNTFPAKHAHDDEGDRYVWPGAPGQALSGLLWNQGTEVIMIEWCFPSAVQYCDVPSTFRGERKTAHDCPWNESCTYLLLRQKGFSDEFEQLWLSCILFKRCVQCSRNIFPKYDLL